MSRRLTPLDAALGGLIAAGALAVAWELAAQGADMPFAVPSIEATVTALPRILGESGIIEHARTSLSALVQILVLALVPGLVFGIGLRAAPGVVRATALMLAAIPLVITLPLFMLSYGLVPQTRIALCGLATLFPVLAVTLSGRGAGNAEATAFAAGDVAAGVFAALRVGVTVSVSLLTLSEMIVSNAGLGFRVMQATMAFDAPGAAALALLVALPTLAFVTLLFVIEAVAAPS